MLFDKLVIYSTITFNVAAFAVFVVGFIKTKRKALGFLATALLCSLIPMAGGLFATEIVVLESGITLRTSFFYVSKSAAVLYFLLLTIAGIALLTEGSRREPNLGKGSIRRDR